MTLNRDFLVTVIAVISFAGLGTLIRTGLSLYIDIGFPEALSLIPNLVGSFILGITKGLSLKNKYIAAGIGTGLCGSITTFSSFNYELNVLIINKKQRVGLGIAFIAITFIGCALTYFIGESISKIYTKVRASPPPSPEISKENPVITQIEMNDLKTDENDEMEGSTKEKEKEIVVPFKEEIVIESKVMITWIMMFIIMNGVVIPLCFMIDNRLWLAILFAPFGAFCRWYLGKLYNKNNRFGIPIGTFIANIIGSTLLMTVLVISAQSENPRYETIWIEAITKGFCGCLSTVSSFIGELFKLRRDAKAKINVQEKVICDKEEMGTYKPSVIYFFLTIIVAQILSTIPNAINVWS